MRFAEDKARDALSFESLPPSRLITVDDFGIVVKVHYSEELSRLLRSLPRGKWEPNNRQWRFPFTSSEDIRLAMPDIERLAAAAKECADKETEQRNAHRALKSAALEKDRKERDHQRAMAQSRPLRQEFLEAVPGRHRYTLTVEAIGDHLRNLGPISGLPQRNWVARIFGSDGRQGWVRAFVSGARDYTHANSVGSRGILVTYFLEEGPIYEISAPQTWGSTDRYFARITDGVLRRMTLEEVEECLSR